MQRSGILCIAAALAAAVSLLSPASPVMAQGASAPVLNILYPKHQSIVGRRVNVVLDPMTDWSSLPLFQVMVGGTAREVVDTSTGRHALQGVALEPGMNTITVKALAPAEKRGSRRRTGAYRVVAVKTVAVFSRAGSFSISPSAFHDQPYHTAENESICSGCHRLTVEEQDRKHEKPESVLCSSCHAEVPAARHTHGPVAVWDCLSCHDPDMTPAKYQFRTRDPWTVAWKSEPVSPAVFTLSAEALFSPNSAVLRSDSVPAGVKGREREVQLLKERELGYFQEILERLRKSPGDRVLVEAHVDRAPLPKGGRYRSHRQLTGARARRIAKLLASYGVTGAGRISARGLGSSLPKVAGRTAESGKLNDRIELVVYPPDIKIANSRNIPTVSNRERVTVTVTYASGSAPVGGLAVVERLADGARYVRRSGLLQGTARDPQVSGRDLIWLVGKTAGPFQATIAFVVEKAAGSATAVDPVTRIRYTAGERAVTREFDPSRSSRGGLSVEKACEKCHGSVATGPIEHGPAGAGYCSLCHDPHGSDYPGWLRKHPWSLCTSCHRSKASEVHLIRGVKEEISHPTRGRADPTRPGKQLSCVSCHSPHGGETRELLKFGARDPYDLCGICHTKK